MRQLGGAPFARQAAQGLARVPGCGQAEAGDFLCAEAREIGDVGRVIERQAEAANFVGKTKAPVMLHRARLRGVGLRIDRRARLAVNDQRAHAAPPQFIGQHQPARACAHNQNVGVEISHNCQPSCFYAKRFPVHG